MIGETLTVCCVAGNTATLTITGVMKNLPDATHLNTDMVIYLQPALFSANDGMLNTWTSLNVYTYFKLNPEIVPQQLEDRITLWMNNESPLIEMFSHLLGDKNSGKKDCASTTL